ncbi:unnamed protein product [Miscanthus lutarioriparius]|uniref:Uncharacterized protein n=1 Tax=Miscanthus lutarioriparius TaxID=422564 RepID=A0A811RR63_9POAL|nr:unnamed protein product [Miscanthus lutarioriparius]
MAGVAAAGPGPPTPTVQPYTLRKEPAPKEARETKSDPDPQAPLGNPAPTRNSRAAESKAMGGSSGEHYSNHTLRGHDDQATQTMESKQEKPEVQNDVSMSFQHCKCGSNKENCNSRLAAPDFDGTVVQLQHERRGVAHPCIWAQPHR